MSREWSQIKRLRAELIAGERCEICGTTEGVIVGHHLLTPKKRYEKVELCELRCWECEKMMHETYEGGNSRQQQIRINKYKKHKDT